MNAEILIRPMREEEAAAVIDVVARAFDRDVAPLYSREGIHNFRVYAASRALVERAHGDHFVLVAELDGCIAGMVEVRANRHIAMLFVDPDHQRRGVARALLRRALELARSRNPGLARVTVNSSPNAAPFYTRAGFHAVSEFQVKNGIAFLPMVLALDPVPPEPAG